jgi:uncharacterized protein YjbI with pentapeptide repeats
VVRASGRTGRRRGRFRRADDRHHVESRLRVLGRGRLHDPLQPDRDPLHELPRRQSRGANLEGADLDRANLRGADLSRASLAGANLAPAYLNGAILTGASLTGARFTHAYLTNANLTFADLTHADLTDANLSHAKLVGATLSGVIWSHTTCPDETNSNHDGNTCVGHLESVTA